MSNIQTQLDYADAIADWFLEIGEIYDHNSDPLKKLKCTYIAANILHRQNRTLSSVRIESNLRSVAENLIEYTGSLVAITRNSDQKEVCLHVMNEALPAGGLSAMPIRWMQNDRGGRIHSVALLSQKLPVPDALLQAVSNSGGSIYTANPSDSFLHRAAWLKKLAYNFANYIILHIDVDDVICGVAFGIKGGPPVLLVNHSAHVFWTGASIADLVVNVRGSDLEGLWAASYRGVSSYSTVPIPLLEPNPTLSDRVLGSELKQQAKKVIGISEDSFVILTVGATFKYLPINELDFIEVCESILKQLPEALLLAVGVEEDSRWKAASGKLGSRIRALGTVSQSRLAMIQEAADVYIEAFPFGTTTALLEAGLKGIPVVLAPAQCPPPYGSDGVALDNTLDRPRSVEEYKAKIIQLSKNPLERAFQGEKIRNSIAKHHIGPGWKKYLEEAIQSLPHEHCTYPSIMPERTPEVIHEYWSTFVSKWGSGYEETLERAISLALSIGLRPRLTKAVLRACRDYRSVRTLGTIPLSLMVFLCNYIFQVVPIEWARNIFDLFSFLFRASLLSRMRRKIICFFGGKDDRRRSWYSEYRNVRE